MRLCQLLGWTILAVFILSAFTPGPRLLAWWLSGPSRLDPADAIVVLATGGVDDSVALSTASLRRTVYAVALYRRGLAPLLVLSGSPSEADERAEIAGKLGVSRAAVLTESRARTTREEALLLRERLQPLDVRRVLLVAELIDMPRARGAFERVGFTVLSAPLDPGAVSDPDSRLALLREMLKEWLAWGYYRLAGYL